MLALGGLRYVRLFRNNVGMAWVGQVLNQTSTTITLVNYRPLHAGLVKGSSDLIGWHSIEVTPEMVGKRIAVFTAIEVKASSKSRRSPEQMAFIQSVHTHGGYAGVATDPIEAQQIVNKPI